MSDKNLPLTDEQIEHIVERVTEKVIENVYISIGKGVVKKFFYIIGIGALGQTYELVNRITTNNNPARIDERTIVILMVNK